MKLTSAMISEQVIYNIAAVSSICNIATWIILFLPLIKYLENRF